jgi:hypothetical protein
MASEVLSWHDFTPIDIDDYCQRTGMVDALTITVNELLEDGIIDYDWWQLGEGVPEEWRARLWTKFVNRYQFREIGILPPARWMARVRARLLELAPKYLPIYDALEAGTTILDDGGEWHKAREVYSSFPQQALRGADADYASSGNDREHETVRTLGLLDVGERIGAYNDVDVMFLDELETLFMGITSTDIPYL